MDSYVELIANKGYAASNLKNIVNLIRITLFERFLKVHDLFDLLRASVDVLVKAYRSVKVTYTNKAFVNVVIWSIYFRGAHFKSNDVLVYAIVVQSRVFSHIQQFICCQGIYKS